MASFGEIKESVMEGPREVRRRPLRSVANAAGLALLIGTGGYLFGVNPGQSSEKTEVSRTESARRVTKHKVAYNEGVAEMQKELVRRGYLTFDDVDGRDGRRTKAAYAQAIADERKAERRDNHRDNFPERISDGLGKGVSKLIMGVGEIVGTATDEIF